MDNTTAMATKGMTQLEANVYHADRYRKKAWARAVKADKAEEAAVTSARAARKEWVESEAAWVVEWERAHGPR